VAANKGEIAALILEPVPGNMGLCLPMPGYLQGLRDICTREGIILIFDEVMTGFRLGKRWSPRAIWGDTRYDHFR